MNDTVRISVRLKPGSKRDSIGIKDGRTVEISITSRPVEGKANEHLIKLLSKILHISKSSCKILHGSKSRSKVIAVKGLNREEIFNKLNNAVTELYS